MPSGSPGCPSIIATHSTACWLLRLWLRESEWSALMQFSTHTESIASGNEFGALDGLCQRIEQRQRCLLAATAGANKFGPYADQLRHLLNNVDGSYLHC